MKKREAVERIRKRAGRWLTAFAITSVLFIAWPSVARDEKDLEIVGFCAKCHGFNGISGDHLTPNLAGQSKAYLIAQLRLLYRSSSPIVRRQKPYNRFHGIMSWVGGELSDDDMRFLALYYTNLPCAPPPGPPPEPPPLVVACEACHSVGVLFGDIPAPNLNGQKRDYLLVQMMALRKSGQGAPADIDKPFRSHQSMGAVMAKFTNKQIADLTHYYSRQSCRP